MTRPIFFRLYSDSNRGHMPLIYAFVSRGTNTVLADYTAYTGNFGVIAVQALERGGQGNNAKFTYSCDGHST